MPSFFVPSNEEARAVLQSQFWLTYSGKFTFLDTEHMIPQERVFFLDQLITQKRAEADAIQNAKTKAAQKS